MLDVLCLATMAVRRHHHPSSGTVRSFGTVSLPQQVEAAVQACSGSRRRDNVTFINIEDLLLQVNFRVTSPELVCSLPVRSCPPSLEQARLGQDKGTQAQADDPGTAQTSQLQCTKQFRRRRRQ